jgi:hypothetical protein
LFATFYQYLATILAKRLKGTTKATPHAPNSRNLAKIEEKKSEPQQKNDEDEFHKLFGLPETEFKIKGNW